MLVTAPHAAQQTLEGRVVLQAVPAWTRKKIDHERVAFLVASLQSFQGVFLLSGVSIQFCNPSRWNVGYV